VDCPIWGTPAEVESPTPDWYIYRSPRAGGQYQISGTAEALVKSFSLAEKKVLTTWLCKQRAAGVSIPQIDEYNIEEIKTYRPMRYTQRVHTALLYFDRLALPLSDSVQLGYEGTDHHPEAEKFVAETESTDLGDLIALLDTMKDSGYLIEHGLCSYAPSPSGWQAIDQLAEQHAVGSQAFVAMWFDPSTEDAYVNGLAKAIYDSGYDPLRIDKKEHNNKIDDEIVAEIRRSRFLVADFTCSSLKVGDDVHFLIRGGVYFEAGFALALPIPVIWTCKDTSIKGLHFDTRQYAHIVWSKADDLYRQLKNRIGATIGDGPRRR
jgi:hypothetical protein